jgi:hypothetical protein
MRAYPHRSISDLLVELVHGGLRLRDGYMSTHRYALEARAHIPTVYAEYRTCLLDTFGSEYVEHLEQWLEAEGVVVKNRTLPLPAPLKHLKNDFEDTPS